MHSMNDEKVNVYCTYLASSYPQIDIRIPYVTMPLYIPKNQTAVFTDDSS